MNKLILVQLTLLGRKCIQSSLNKFPSIHHNSHNSLCKCCWNTWNVIQMRFSLRRWDHTEKGGWGDWKGGALTALWNETDATFQEIRALREGGGGKVGGSLLSHISSQKHFHSSICSATSPQYWGRDAHFLFPLKILSVTSSCASASQNSGYIQPCQGSEALTDTQRYYGLAGDEYVKDEN